MTDRASEVQAHLRHPGGKEDRLHGARFPAGLMDSVEQVFVKDRAVLGGQKNFVSV